jgi:hypothetical protein
MRARIRHIALPLSVAFLAVALALLGMRNDGPPVAHAWSAPAISASPQVLANNAVWLGLSDSTVVDGVRRTGVSLSVGHPRGAELGLLAGSGVGQAPPVGVTAEADHWHTLDTGTTEDFLAVWGSSSSDLYAIADYNTVLHYNGVSWTQKAPAGVAGSIHDIWQASPSDVYVLGYVTGEPGKKVLHFDGTSWTDVCEEDCETVDWFQGYAIWGSSPSDIWVVGVDGRYLHYDGAAWELDMFGPEQHCLDVYGFSASDVFVAQNDEISHFDGSHWYPLNPPGYGGPIGSVRMWGTSRTDLYVSGWYAVDDGWYDTIHFDGNEWTVVEVSCLNHSPTSVWGTSPCDIFAFWGGKLCHFDGSSWSLMSPEPGPSPAGMWGTRLSDVFAPGQGGKIWRYLRYVGPVAGDVTDGHGNPLREVNVALLEEGGVVAETATDDQGSYQLYMPRDSACGYRARVTLKEGTTTPPTFQIRYGVLSPHDGPVAYAETQVLGMPDPPFHLEHDISFADTAVLDTDATIPLVFLDDMANIYFRTKQAVDFATDELNVTLDEDLPIDVNTWSMSGTLYLPGRTSIFISLHDSDSDWEDRNDPNLTDEGPMNAEWHEFFHHLMEDTITIPTREVTSTNHGGYANPSTRDSWTEGYAEFWPMVLKDHLGLPNPDLYDRHGSLEFNWAAWSRLMGHSREEFAVASLLWDLYDSNAEYVGRLAVITPPGNPSITHTIGITYDDHLDLSLQQMWDVIGSTKYSALRDVYDVYEAFRAAGYGQGDVDNDGDIDGDGSRDLTDLDELFILHGFFADTDGDFYYREGDAVGRAADTTRPDRRKQPKIEGANLSVSINDLDGAPLSGGYLVVEVDFPDDSFDYTYETILDQATGELVYFELPPYDLDPRSQDVLPPPDPESDFVVTATLHATVRGVESEEQFSFDNVAYWNAVVSTTEEYAMAYTFSVDVYRLYLPLVLRGS